MCTVNWGGFAQSLNFIYLYESHCKSCELLWVLYNVILFKSYIKDTVRAGIMGQISTLTLDCGVLENIAIKGRLVNLDLNFIFFLHCWYIFLHLTTVSYKKPKIFGLQILRVIWDSCVLEQIERFFWRIFNLLYLTIIFKKYVPIWDH